MGRRSIRSITLGLVLARVRLFASTEALVTTLGEGRDDGAGCQVCRSRVRSIRGRVTHCVRLGTSLCRSCTGDAVARRSCLLVKRRCTGGTSSLQVFLTRLRGRTRGCDPVCTVTNSFTGLIRRFGGVSGLSREVMSTFVSRVILCRSKRIRMGFGFHSRLSRIVRLTTVQRGRRGQCTIWAGAYRMCPLIRKEYQCWSLQRRGERRRYHWSTGTISKVLS